MLGFNGKDPEEARPLIDKLQPGALILFQRNIESPRQTRELIDRLQALSVERTGLPLLIATDQEGGAVVRVRTNPPLPSALALGELDDLEVAYRTGRAAGRLLKAVGINMNLAPVVDVTDSSQQTFIRTRSFGRDPERVAVLATEMARGLQETGVLPTAKHFPGHGSLNDDTHVEAAEKQTPLEKLRRRDLEPYRAMMRDLKRPFAAMLAHIAYPSVDPTRTPATFSKKIVSGLLRQELGFSGLVVTDDIDMQAAQTAGSFGERAVRSIEAGSDMVMLTWNMRRQTQVLDAIERAVRSGRISEARLNESVRRVLRMKSIYARDALVRPPDKAILAGVRNADLRYVADRAVRFSFDRALRAHSALPSSEAAAVRGADLRQPASHQGGPVNLLEAGESLLVFAGQRTFFDSFRRGMGLATGAGSKRRDQLERLRFVEISPQRPMQVQQELERHPLAVGLLYVSGQQMARLASSIPAEIKSRIMVINAETRGSLTDAGRFRLIVDVGFRHPRLGQMAAESFFAGARLTDGSLALGK
jgi:beta-glucosidase-like glycosyl hydrolase